MYSKLNVGKKILVGCHLGILRPRKLEKEMEKYLERHEVFIGILFMKIKEIRIKVRWKVTGYMWGGNWRKIMENEENIGLVDKKASED